MTKPKILDLFCGCGGFSLGAHRAGFSTALAVDIDPILSSAYRLNFPAVPVLTKDIRELDGDEVTRAARSSFDGIIGGPPCQGFSEIGRQSQDDPRRHLIGEFFRLVDELQPSFFVLENVRGLVFSKNRPTLDAQLAKVGPYRLFGPAVLHASEFGAATSRPRVIVVGIRMDRIAGDFAAALEVRRRKPTTVREAIADLTGAVADGFDEDGFDKWRYAIDVPAGRYAEWARADACGGTRAHFSGNRATHHGANTVARFRAIAEGATDPVGRHKRLDWNGLAPTLRAGTGSDKGSFQSVRPLHPSEHRVITVREAARLQGFPDSFRFHPTVWHSFRMIGNSVSPLMSQALLAAVARSSGSTHRLAAAE